MNQNMSLVNPTFSCFPNSIVQQNAFNKNNHNVPPQGLAIQFDQQKEIDRYIRSQNEKLRILLQEQSKQHVAELLKKAELNAVNLLRQKDEEIAQATKKTIELNEFLKRLETENQSWRKVAEENEDVMLSLHNTLELMKAKTLHLVTTQEAESDENMRNTPREEGIGENSLCHGGVGEVQQIKKNTLECKCCISQKSCFMFLPCRHLCSCKTCEPFLQVCPVCNVPKKSSIETLIV